jgi:pimeloyl-ACP methyl ester carboxylesterase
MKQSLAMSSANDSGRASVNGVTLYYEIHGKGAPLVMLHGGVNPSEMFGGTLAEMAKSHRVVAVHLRGHGFSTDADDPWTYEGMADDVAALMGQLKIARADLMGYSTGAGVALQIAIRHPERVGKLVAISMAYRADGDYPEVRAAFDAMPQVAPAIARQIARSPLARLYPEIDWERMMRKTGEMNQPAHDWSKGVAAMAAPTLLIFADADSIQLDHMTSFYKLLGGGQRDGGMDGSGRSVNRLAIIPNRTHYDLLSSPLVTQCAADFLAMQ